MTNVVELIDELRNADVPYYVTKLLNKSADSLEDLLNSRFKVPDLKWNIWSKDNSQCDKIIVTEASANGERYIAGIDINGEAYWQGPEGEQEAESLESAQKAANKEHIRRTQIKILSMLTMTSEEGKNELAEDMAEQVLANASPEKIPPALSRLANKTGNYMFYSAKIAEDMMYHLPVMRSVDMDTGENRDASRLEQALCYIGVVASEYGLEPGDTAKGTFSSIMHGNVDKGHFEITVKRLEHDPTGSD